MKLATGIIGVLALILVYALPGADASTFQSPPSMPRVAGPRAFTSPVAKPAMKTLTTCPGIEPSDIVTDSIKITATQIVTDSLSLTDTSDFYRLTPRCPTPAHYRPLVIRPLVPGFVPKKRIWIGSVGANGTYWSHGDWALPTDMASCASDWTQCYLSSLIGCPPANYYTDIYIEVATGGTSQDVPECRLYRVEWSDTYKTHLPLIVR